MKGRDTHHITHTVEALYVRTCKWLLLHSLHHTTAYMYHIARKFGEDFKYGDVAYHDNIANLNTQFSCGNVTVLLYVRM